MTSGDALSEPADRALILLDTNVLVYGYFAEDPRHATCRALLDQAQDAGAGFCVAPQNLVEFFSIETSPKRVTRARATAEAAALLDELLALPGLTLLAVPPDVVDRWLRMIRQYSARGPKVFDLQLAATMLGNGVSKLHTYNLADFQHIRGILATPPP